MAPTIGDDVKVELDGQSYTGVVKDANPDEMMFEVDLDGIDGTNWFDVDDVSQLHQ